MVWVRPVLGVSVTTSRTSGGRLTVWVTAVEVLPMKLVSPL